jgi:hypothetical protein
MSDTERQTFGRSAAPKPKVQRRLIAPKDLPAKGIHYHANHLRRMWRAGLFPKPIHLSPRRIAFDEAAVDAWIEAKLSRQE